MPLRQMGATWGEIVTSEEAPERPRRSAATKTLAARSVADLVALVFAITLAYWIRFGLGWPTPPTTPELTFTSHVAVAALWIVGVLGGMATNRLYDEDTLFPGSGEMARIRRALIEGLALVALAVFLLQVFEVSRAWIILVFLLSMLCLTSQRLLFRRFLRRVRAAGHLQRRAMLVSGSQEILEQVGEHTAEFNIVERVTTDQLDVALNRELTLTKGQPPVVIIDGSGISHDDFWLLVIQAGQAGCSVFVRSPVRAVRPDRLTTRELDGETIMKVTPPALVGFRAFAKRSFDIGVAAFLLVLLAIPMALLALLALITSGRPIFYGQQRVGLDGRLFTMWKFRSMKTGAEDDSGPVWATKDDPRRTPLGAWLRRWSLDELPQFLNVVLGNMSMVGPRPERPLFVSKFSDGNEWYRFRHRTRPGITGLSQVRGQRGDSPLEPRIQSDNWYIEHWSLTLDVRILLQTFGEVLRGRNAA